MFEMPLYSRIHLSSAPDDVARIYSLLQDYIEHPHRAESVKEVVYRCALRKAYHFAPVPLRAPAQEKEAKRDVSGETAIANALERLDLGDKKDEWIRYLTWMKPENVAARDAIKTDKDRADEAYQLDGWWGAQDSLFAQYAGTLLLMMCPNVEKLTYVDNGGPAEAVLQRNNYGKLPQVHLQRLRDVVLMPIDHMILNDPRFYVNTDPIGLVRLFHRLPAIESVSMAGISIHGGSDYQPYAAPAISNIKRIRLEHVELGSSTTGSIIRMSRGLEELTLTQGGRATSDGSFSLKHPKTHGKALACHRGTLSKLDLDLDAPDWLSVDLDEDQAEDYGIEADEDYDWRDGYQKQDELESPGPLFTWQIEDTSEYQGTIGRMHDFERLTHVSIGIGSLLGPRGPYKTPFRLVDMLPKSLEYLLLRGYEKGAEPKYDHEVEELMLRRATRFPKLREVHGIEQCIPGGENVEDPDNSEDLLWEPEEVDKSWVEASGDAEKVAEPTQATNKDLTSGDEPVGKRRKVDGA